MLQRTSTFVVLLTLLLAGCGGGRESTHVPVPPIPIAQATPASAPSQDGTLQATLLFASPGPAKGVFAQPGGLPASASRLVVHLLDPATGSEVASAGSPLTLAHTVGDTSPMTVSFANLAPGSYTLVVEAFGTAFLALGYHAVSMESSGVQVTIDSAVNPISLAVSPQSPTIGLSQTRQFAAVLTLSDGLSLNVTGMATWSSSAASIATIDATGQATAGSTLGTSTIEAAYQTVSASTILTVNGRVPVSLAVAPANASIPKGTSVQLTATLSFSDGTSQDVTPTATWTSSTEAVTVDANGLARGAGVGTASVAATSNGISGQTSVTVTAATIVSIAVTPGSATIEIGQTQQFAAVATFTDGSQSAVTSTAGWSVDNTAVASIGPDSGLASGAAEGSVAVTASQEGVSGTATLNIVPDPLFGMAGNTLQNVVAVGGNSSPLIFTSTDAGATFTARTAPNANGLNGIAYLPGWNMFVGLGDTGDLIRSVDDGLTWQQANSGVTADLNDAVQGAGAIAVVVGNGGTIRTTDDISATPPVWTPRVSGTTVDLLGVIFDGATYAAVGRNGTVLVSVDAITWDPRATSSTADITDVWFGLGVLGTPGFYAVDAAGGIYTSGDGAVWTRTQVTAQPLHSIAFGLNAGGAPMMCAVGDNGTILTTPDGTTWTARTSPTTLSLLGVARVTTGDGQNIFGLAGSRRFRGVFGPVP